MTAGDYTAMGRLGDRKALLPRPQAELERPGAAGSAERRGLFGRRRAGGAGPSRTVVHLVDYSVTGVGFTVDADGDLAVGQELVLHLGSASSRIRLVESHDVDGERTWGAMLLDPRPEVVRAIEEDELERDVAGEEARFNAGRD